MLALMLSRWARRPLNSSAIIGQVVRVVRVCIRGVGLRAEVLRRGFERYVDAACEGSNTSWPLFE